MSTPSNNIIKIRIFSFIWPHHRKESVPMTAERLLLTYLHLIAFVCRASGEPSTWFPLERLVHCMLYIQNTLIFISKHLQTHSILFSNHFLEKFQFSKFSTKKWPYIKNFNHIDLPTYTYSTIFLIHFLIHYYIT